MGGQSQMHDRNESDFSLSVQEYFISFCTEIFIKQHLGIKRPFF